MTLSEYTQYLSGKGFDIKYREVLGGSLKILVSKRGKSIFELDETYSTTVYSSEIRCRSMSEYNQLIMERIRRLINQKFTEPVDTTMQEIKE